MFHSHNRAKCCTVNVFFGWETDFLAIPQVTSLSTNQSRFWNLCSGFVRHQTFKIDETAKTSEAMDTLK